MNKLIHKIESNSFCYVCAQFVDYTKRKLTETLQEAYWNYFKINCPGIGKNFASSYICATCHRNLYRYHRNNQFIFLLVALQFGLNVPVMNTGFAISAQFRSLY